MSTYLDKSVSLIERKKQQWAKEREELARISGYWRQSSEPQYYTAPFDRHRYASKFPMVQTVGSKDTERRSSLPPLYKNQYNSYDREKEHGGETSGYGSDVPEYPQIQSGYESSSSRDDRPKWGDKGVGVGKFWSPKEEAAEKSDAEPPNWVKRGLKDGEILVSNTSPAESPEQNYEEQDRPCTTGSSSSHNRSYIRGQNIPIDSQELAERERKRQAALAHQEAIRQQLAEREIKRREERERKIQEEREEELRIEREQELERRRQEHEQKLQREKLERERKRKEAIQEALEIAQKEAKLEKMKHRMLKYTQENDANYLNIAENVVEKNDGVQEKPPVELNNNCDTDNSTKEEAATANNKPAEIMEDAKIHNNLKDVAEVKPFTRTPVATPRPDYQALIFQTPLDVLQSIPYAVLVPTFNPSTPMPITLPAMHTERATSTRTENRILTPTQYRNKNSRLCDSSTQTENEYFPQEPCEKFVRDKFNNIELTYDNRSRKGRRSRNDDRRSESVEERPKWGANRPPTRYLKQSEKDLLYQRRKLRQKARDDKNSSDESQLGSPRSYRKKGYIDKRATRALWKKSDQARMYQTEIIPLESDKDHLYYRENQDCCCRCRCHCDRHNVKVDILKIEHASPRDPDIIDTHQRLPDCVPTENTDILDKLATLHNGLLMKQEQWKHSPRTPSLTTH